VCPDTTSDESYGDPSDSDAFGRFDASRRFASAHAPRDDRYRTRCGARRCPDGQGRHRTATPEIVTLVDRLEKVTGVDIAELGNDAEDWREV
jgi:hypothetical protein